MNNYVGEKGPLFLTIGFQINKCRRNDGNKSYY